MPGMFIHPPLELKFREAGTIGPQATIEDFKWTGLGETKCDNCGDLRAEPARVSIRDTPKSPERDMYICRFCIGVITM